MENLNDLSSRQIKLIGASLIPLMDSVMESELESADQVVSDITSILARLSNVIEERDQVTQNFCEIVNELLSDVDKNSIQIVANPEIELPEYN